MKLSAKFARQESEEARLARVARRRIPIDRVNVPRDLRDEPALAKYVAAFGPLPRLAQKPSPCVGSGGDMEHVFYTRLLNDLAIYGIGLARRDRTLARLQAMLDQRATQPATFACTLVPRKAPGGKRPGCGERHYTRREDGRLSVAPSRAVFHSASRRRRARRRSR